MLVAVVGVETCSAVAWRVLVLCEVVDFASSAQPQFFERGELDSAVEEVDVVP